MTVDRTKDRYIPSGYQKITYTQPVDAVAYWKYDGKYFIALGFEGRAGKKSFHYRFLSQAAMQGHLSTFFTNRIEHNERVAKRKAEAKAFVHDLKVGEILVCSWGYDQTNVDFYQVVSTTTKMATTREIGSMSVDNEGCTDMTDKVYPKRDEFIGKPMSHLVQEGNNIRISSYSSACRWDYNPCYTSSYA